MILDNTKHFKTDRSKIIQIHIPAARWCSSQHFISWTFIFSFYFSIYPCSVFFFIWIINFQGTFGIQEQGKKLSFYLLWFCSWTWTVVLQFFSQVSGWYFISPSVFLSEIIEIMNRCWLAWKPFACHQLA